ncbi:PREDICTED: cinnamoyl-CoA reductase 1-like isoform X2 [Lupinus angustifolius]|uniref:cinnamoyl-CoA reductase 1-like isoform X2 n=1 Tax=Lupinus angustifolius TaxID=3871 RepID=UPI00092E215F|nr:PREDICTED: cinnamoyl-CoA reductase 1-like isoform X2 [Lupinus angustifolius]
MSKLVYVTGASGYIASWIVKFLLQRGYTVRATVRDPSNPKKIQHLVQLDGANERLQLYKADLLQQGSFDSAIQGCDAVFHTASPVPPPAANIQNPQVLFCLFQVEVIDPAVKGTVNVLESCAKSPSVKRIILTSSMIAAFYNGMPLSPEVEIDETWFSNPDFCMQTKKWYAFAKTSAEDIAWKFVKEKKIDMVVINPTVTVGPLLQPELNSSAALIFNLINGSETFPNISYPWVNVKDVADAHVKAYETPSASGRYILSERVTHLSEVVKILRNLYPTLQIADKCADNEPFMTTYKVSKEKAKHLGIEFIPLDMSLKETVESLKEKKFVNDF